MRRVVLLVLSLLCASAFAADGLVRFEARPGAKLGYWWMPRPDAHATLLLIPGGDGAIGLRDGVPRSTNFLVRTRDEWAAAGFNVALLGRPSDRTTMDGEYRRSAEHMAELRAVVARLRADGKLPVWLVGTSRGTLSAAAAAITFEPGMIAGIVLTSSITDGGARSVAVPEMGLAAIRVPVLVYHHKRDACLSCPARRTDAILSALTAAPVKKLVIVDGGEGAHGDPCEPMHWHGFVGMEREAVGAITSWIRKPGS